MAVVARNAYKGYTYQEYIHLFFTALMDTEKKIAEIEAEIISEQKIYGYIIDIYVIDSNGYIAYVKELYFFLQRKLLLFIFSSFENFINALKIKQ